MNKAFAIFALLFCSFVVQAQFDHINVLKGISGDALFDGLNEEYKASTNLSYGEARDTLYSLIDVLPGNKLECIYTGYQITLNPNLDPTEDAFAKGINAEHSYPQSKGAGDGLGRSDMHHLYPSRVNVNSDRGSHPFGDAVDSKTDFWYFNDIKVSNIPSTNIDAYSELDNNNIQTVFEPRESVKGNIARGIFYFYTMYRQEALDAEPTFFDIQRQTLCDWHMEDPVDEREWNRTFQIAKYQDGKVNPFVLDCSLASRLYCDDIDDACELLTSSRDLTTNPNIVVSRPYPIPTSDNVRIGISTPTDIEMMIQVMDVFGVIQSQFTQIISSDYSINLEVPLPEKTGLYYIIITTTNGQTIYRKVIKI